MTRASNGALQARFKQLLALPLRGGPTAPRTSPKKPPVPCFGGAFRERGSRSTRSCLKRARGSRSTRSCLKRARSALQALKAVRSLCYRPSGATRHSTPLEAAGGCGMGVLLGGPCGGQVSGTLRAGFGPRKPLLSLADLGSARK
eukprot:11967500-Alexandrium_andersonii.AAC.1